MHRVSNLGKMCADDYRDEKYTTILEDRLDNPAQYDNLRRRRIIAFIIDYILIAVLHIPFAILIGFVGIITLGLGWLLFFIITPLLAALYVGLTMGGPQQATPGMKIMSIRIAKLDGTQVDFLTAIVHGAIFWAANIITSGFVLLIGLFTDRKRLVHDLLLGTVVFRDDIAG